MKRLILSLALCFACVHVAMAGITVNDLPTLTTPASGDKLYIIDISDTTDGAGGTGKSINWSYLSDDVRNNINWSALSQDIQATGINWSSLDKDVQASGVNWSSLDQDVQRSGINWTSLDQDIQATGINWSSLDKDIQAMGVNWASLSQDVQASGVNWSSLDQDVQRQGINWTSANIFVTSATGNVGIGTPNPQALFHVNGTAQFGTASTGTWAATSGMTIDANNDSAADVTITSGGNVGVGSTSPQGRFQAAGGDVFVGSGSFTNTSAADDLYVAGNLEVAGTIYGDGGGISNITSSQWTTTGSNIYFDTGNVGIGTNAPSGPLDVRGTGDLIITGGNVGIGSTTPRGAIDTATGTAYLGGIVASGNVGISTTAPANGCKCSVFTNGICTTVGVCD